MHAATASGVRLPTPGPFHLEATVRVLQRRPAHLVDRFEHGSYRRVLRLPGGVALIEAHNLGSIDHPDLRLSIAGAPAAGEGDTASRAVRRILGLEASPTALARLGSAAPVLAPTLAALRGLRPPRFASLFEAFASVVPFQQLSLESGIATLNRLVARFGGAAADRDPHQFAFPEAEAVAQARLAQLRSCGLSRRKAEALRAIAGSIAAGALREQQLEAMRSSEALRVLQELPGIGPWSAALVLLRGLGRTDVFPPGDVAAAPGARCLLGLATATELERLLERLGDLRGYLYYCALGDQLLRRGLIQAASNSTSRCRKSRRSDPAAPRSPRRR